MAVLALVALVFGLPFYALYNVGGESTTQGQTPSVPAPKAATGRASIALTSMQPLTIVGRGFKSGERVRISGAGVKTVVASRRGGFTARMTYRNPCPSLSITAVGSKGSRASLNFSQLLCVEP